MSPELRILTQARVTPVADQEAYRLAGLDTATLCGIAFGQTVLSRAAKVAGFPFDEEQAHSAAYDAEITADVFCKIVNNSRDVFEASLPKS